jgi:DDE_Tnp_1-associated/Transposase DDE domain
MSTPRSSEIFNHTTLSLFEALYGISDPRKKRGVRHNFHSILQLVILGFCSRLVCLEHIVEFARHCWSEIKEPLGFNRDAPPDATTIGRVLKKIDREELEWVFRQWVSTKLSGKKIDASVDGKALRNVCDEKGNPIYMINVFAHDVQMVLAQKEIPKKKGESTTLKTMLEGLFDRYPGLRLLTGDAAFNGRDLCKEIARLGKHYLVQIKRNQEHVFEVLQLHFDEEKCQRAPDAETVEKKTFEKNYCP